MSDEYSGLLLIAHYSSLIASVRARKGDVDLDDPAVTLLLLQHNAVVGVTGFFENGELKRVASTMTGVSPPCSMS